jgi:hypothetical protein
MNAFTRAILRELVIRPGETAETVREWFREEEDPEQRARHFAAMLAEDLAGGAVESETASELIRLCMKRVDYLAVARWLLKRFDPVKRQRLRSARPSQN